MTEQGQERTASELLPDELDELTRVLRAEGLSGRHLEIGTAGGGTLVKMMQAYAPGRVPPFEVVDPMAYFENQLEVVRANLTRNGIDPEQVNFRVMSSVEAHERAAREGRTYDFIFVDGNHKYRHVVEDLRWAQLLGVGGLMAFHDYKPAARGVMWATDRFLRRNRNYERIGLTNSLLFMRKASESRRREVGVLDKLLGVTLSQIFQLELSVKKRWARWTRKKSS